MTQSGGYAIKQYLSLVNFYGHSQSGIRGDLGTTNAAATLVGLPANRRGGQDASPLPA